MAVDQVLRKHQNDTSSASGLDDELVTRLESGLPQRVDWQCRLILAADSRVAAPPLLYLGHKQ